MQLKFTPNAEYGWLLAAEYLYSYPYDILFMGATTEQQSFIFNKPLCVLITMCLYPAVFADMPGT